MFPHVYLILLEYGCLTMLLISDTQHSDSAICLQNHKQLSIWLRAKAQVLRTFYKTPRPLPTLRSPFTINQFHSLPSSLSTLCPGHTGLLFLKLTHHFPISGSCSAVPSAYSAVSPVVLITHSLTSFKVLVAQACPALCDPMDCSPPNSFVLGILQARILEWAAISFSRGSSPPRDQTQVSHIAGVFFTA